MLRPHATTPCASRWIPPGSAARRLCSWTYRTSTSAAARSGSCMSVSVRRPARRVRGHGGCRCWNGVHPLDRDVLQALDPVDLAEQLGHDGVLHRAGYAPAALLQVGPDALLGGLLA